MPVGAPFDRKAIEDAIYNWIVTSTGVPAFWEFQKKPQPAYPFATMRIGVVSRIGGEDEKRIEEDPGANAGQEIEQISAGPRRMTVSVNFHTSSNDPQTDAYALAAKAQAALSLQSYAEPLYAAGLAVIAEGQLSDLSFLAAETWIARCQFDVVFGIAYNISDFTGYIATVEVDAPFIGWDDEVFPVG